MSLDEIKQAAQEYVLIYPYWNVNILQMGRAIVAKEF